MDFQRADNYLKSKPSPGRDHPMRLPALNGSQGVGASPPQGDSESCVAVWRAAWLSSEDFHWQSVRFRRRDAGGLDSGCKHSVLGGYNSELCEYGTGHRL